jgi:hypothetical protein
MRVLRFLLLRRLVPPYRSALRCIYELQSPCPVTLPHDKPCIPPWLCLRMLPLWWQQPRGQLQQ